MSPGTNGNGDTMLVLTARSNDVSFDVVFARQIAAFGRRGDVVVGLSTSGNSTNLVRAFDEASRRGLLTVGVAGYEGGMMAELGSIDHRSWCLQSRYTGFRRRRPRFITHCGSSRRAS